MKQIPYIAKDSRGLWTLYVDEKPYLMLGGEIHNSSSSSLPYMKEKVWTGVEGLHLNTLIVPVAWETIEPEEGMFTFENPSGLIDQAREHGMRLVILWFGLWKNGESTYVPEWVKADTKRFIRACYPGGVPSETISPLCQEAVEADKRAFTKFMEFLKEKDEETQTVLAVQVENEIGFLGSDRDYSPLAETVYQKPVPEALAAGDVSWEALYGEDAPEMFMAWHYASAVETIASAGKQVYPLPMYVNAWLNQFPDRAGNYPSGGPIARNVPVWKKAALHIDAFAPDIYLSDFDRVCEEYAGQGGPLLIPEARRDAVTASNVFPAFATHHSLGFSPFGIEDFRARIEDEEERQEDKEVLEQLQIDMLGFVCNGTGKYLARSYELMESIQDLYFQYRGTDDMQGFSQKSEHDRGTILRLKNCELELTWKKHPLSEPGCAGMVIEDTDHSFWIFGYNTGVRLLPPRGTKKSLTLLNMEEGHFENSKWIKGRVLNGDERYRKNLGAYPTVLRFSYQCYEA